MMKAIKLFVLVFMVTLFSCTPDHVANLSLPPITQTGQNTLGFMLDNKVWTNFGRRCTIAGCSDNKVAAHLYRQPNGDLELEIIAGYTVTSEGIDQSFFIHGVNVTSTGTFLLDSTLGRELRFTGSNYNQTYKEYKNRLPHYSVLSISRFDTTNLVIAGTFHGVLHNPADPADSVSIMDGRFDAQLDYRR
jgi:hypothetical protein